MNKYIKIFLFLINIGSISTIGGEVKTIKNVSIIELIASPEKFDGELITVTGFTFVSPTRSLMYISHIDYEHNIHYNTIGLALDRIEKRPGYIMQKNDKVQKQYSIIQGTFNAKRKMGNLIHMGTIEKITRFDAWDYLYDSGINKE